MPPITALIYTENDALRLGRCLETLYPCDNIVIVDNGSSDGTVSLAHEYGAKIVSATPGASPDDFLRTAGLLSAGLLSAGQADAQAWILCLDPHESLTESLAASLFEWKSETESVHRNGVHPLAFSMFLREETAEGWIELPAAQTRLVPQAWNRWNGRLPVHDPSALALEGELLRFVFP
jgi:glycosyltransferase involved in cell wall biosynthesis